MKIEIDEAIFYRKSEKIKTKHFSESQQHKTLAF